MQPNRFQLVSNDLGPFPNLSRWGSIYMLRFFFQQKKDEFQDYDNSGQFRSLQVRFDYSYNSNAPVSFTNRNLFERPAIKF